MQPLERLSGCGPKAAATVHPSPARGTHLTRGSTPLQRDRSFAAGSLARDQQLPAVRSDRSSQARRFDSSDRRASSGRLTVTRGWDWSGRPGALDGGVRANPELYIERHHGCGGAFVTEAWLAAAFGVHRTRGSEPSDPRVLHWKRGLGHVLVGAVPGDDER